MEGETTEQCNVENTEEKIFFNETNGEELKNDRVVAELNSVCETEVVDCQEVVEMNKELEKKLEETETEKDYRNLNNSNNSIENSLNSIVNKEEAPQTDEMFPCYPAPPLEVKLFVGRIPRTFNEEDIKPIFAEYGKVVGVSVIRDKNNSTHKGSAFVRMACVAQADGAVRALNNQKVLDESLGPLQVKYAMGEAEKLGINDAAGEAGLDQAKLFIGSIPKSMNETEIKEFFCPYGQVDEIYIMKDPGSGQGKGCAFVKYAYKEQAVYAVKCLDRKHTFEGCSRPVEVRFAENRAQQRQQQQQQGTTSGTVSAAPTAMSCIFPPSNMIGMQQTGMRGAFPATGAMPGTYQSIMPTMPCQQVATTTVAPASVVPRQECIWKEYISPEGRPYYHNELTNTTQWEKPAEFDAQTKGNMMNAITSTPTNVFSNMNAAAMPGVGVLMSGANANANANVGVGGVGGNGVGGNVGGGVGGAGIVTNMAGIVGNHAAYIPGVAASQAFTRPVGSAYGGSVSQDIAVGPPGANIFIFHVPPEWTNNELLAAFSPFGNVISARVATDKSANNKTKGYAFVSYDNVESAALAITHMNGFLWGGKKLKVTIKKGEEYVAQQMLIANASKVPATTISTINTDVNNSIAAATSTSAAAAAAAAVAAAATAGNGGILLSAYTTCNGQTPNSSLQTINPHFNLQYNIPYNAHRYTPY